MIETQIFYNKLTSICKEMGENLQRTSRSPLLAQDRAFAAAFVTENMELAVQIQYEPEHLYSLRESTRHLFDYFSYDIAEGDVFITADPYTGGTQAQTLTMAAPCFHEGELIPFPVLRAQLTDLAGEFPGGYNAEAFEVWQESIRLSPVKLYRGGVLQRDVWRFLMANSRVPGLLASDLDAMVACCRLAQKQVQLLLSKHSLQHVESMLNDTFRYSRNRVVQHIQHISERTVKGKSTVYGRNGDEWPIAVAVRREEEQILVDFSGTHDQVEEPYNSPIDATKAFAVWPMIAAIADEVSINEGMLQSFIVKTEAGTLLQPKFPAATAFCGKITGHFIAEAVTFALKSGGFISDSSMELHSPGPQAVMYTPIGRTAENLPMFIVPGYPVAKNGWGPSGLFGDRQLVSAEELELHHGLKMAKREWEGEGMVVSLINQKGTLQANLIIPNEVSYGSIEVVGRKTTQYTNSVNSISLNEGERITFSYPGARRQQYD